MKKLFLGFLILPLIVSNVSASTAKSQTESVVFGSDNLQVHSSAETEVNGKRVKVETNQPGSLEVEVKDNETKIRTSQGLTPTIVVSGEEIKPTIIQEEMKVLPRPDRVFSFLKDFLERILKIFGS